jgi:hypothetical protein
MFVCVTGLAIAHGLPHDLLHYMSHDVAQVLNAMVIVILFMCIFSVSPYTHKHTNPPYVYLFGISLSSCRAACYPTNL